MKTVGDNYHNNAVSVDVKTGKVDFRPVQGNQNLVKYFARYCLYSIVVSGMVCIYYLIFASAVLYVSMGKVFDDDMLAILFAASILCGVIYSLRYLHDGWRKDEYPMEQSRLSDALSMLISFTRDKKKYVFDHKSLIEGNKAIIPSFGNVSLDYKATGDMGLKLDRIDVVNPFKDQAFKWTAVFIFNDTPAWGKLYVEYQ